MILLGIDTATPVTSVALRAGAEVHLEQTPPGVRGHVEFLTPAIATLLDRAGVGAGDLDAVAVDIGPGLFTGMRVGIATAKTLASALDIPVLPVPSLDVLAHAALPLTDLVACIDARRGEVFAAFYASGGRDGEIGAWSPADLAAAIAARGDPVMVGDGASAYPDVLGAEEPPVRHPSAAALVDLAASPGRVAPVAADLVEPLYVRRSDAEIKWADRGVQIQRPLRVKIPKRAGEERA